MRTYQVTFTRIGETSDVFLWLFLSTWTILTAYNDEDRTAACLCSSRSLASLLVLHLQNELECDISYRPINRIP